MSIMFLTYAHIAQLIVINTNRHKNYFHYYLQIPHVIVSIGQNVHTGDP